jgi:hypothetical protein
MGSGTIRLETDNVSTDSYYQHLRKHVDGFRHLQDEKQLILGEIFKNQSLRDAFRHRKHRGYQFYPKTVLREQFGKNYRRITETFFDINHDYLWGQEDKKKNYTKGYKVKSEILETVADYIWESSHGNRSGLLINGKPYRRRGNGVSSRDINGNCRSCRVHMRPTIFINTENLHAKATKLSKAYDAMQSGREPNTQGIEAFYSHISGRYPDKTDRLDKIQWYTGIIFELLRLSNVKPLQHGEILQLYRETSTGRLQGQDLHLQTIPKLIRTEALRGLGLWLYDFDNCHYQILEQMANRHGISLPMVKKYNTDKNAFRGAISDELGVSIDQVKKALMSIAYGAVANTGHAISKTIGDKDREFLNHPFVTGLFSDIRECRNELIDNAERKRSRTGYRIMNDAGKGISEDEDKKTILAHLLQGAEAAMLNSIINAHEDSMYLLLFDGWISNERMDVEALETQVKNDTGYTIKITEEKVI